MADPPGFLAAAVDEIDVIDKEQLVANAHAGGAYLRAGISRLAPRYPWIREVRGAGLFVGVELGPHPITKLTGRQEAARIVNDLRHRGVLVGTTGRDSNILKIRPPLTISPGEVDVLLEALEQSLSNA